MLLEGHDYNAQIPNLEFFTNCFHEGELKNTCDSKMLFRHQKEIDDSVRTQLFTFSSFHELKHYRRQSTLREKRFCSTDGGGEL